MRTTITCSFLEDKDVTKSSLSLDFTIAENWFFVNYGNILNPGKCHFIRSDKNGSDSELLRRNDLNLDNAKEIEISRFTIDTNVNLKNHIKNIFTKTSRSKVKYFVKDIITY